MNWILITIWIVIFISVPPSKKELKKILTDETELYNKGGRWYTNNNDSSFFKADTIKFYQGSSYAYQAKGICHFIVWAFSKNNKVSFGEEITCQEPPVSIGYGDGRFFFDYKVKSTNENLELILSNKSGKQVFQIVSLEDVELYKGKKSKLMTMVRKKV